MSGWELSLIATPPTDLDSAALTAIETCSDLKELSGLTLLASRPQQSIALAELFRIQRRNDDQIVVSGDLKSFHRIGYGWTQRSLLIEGDVGSGLGTGMRGGSIVVQGNTLDFAACQMRGGLIRVAGHTGDYLGGPLPGRRSGMSGGRVVITRNAGHHAGHRLRRGTIIIAGDVNDGVASDMVAGTIAIGGRVGDFVAAGMRRGTLILRRTVALDPVRFSAARTVDLGVSRLIAHDLQADAPEIAAALRGPLQRSLGDRSAAGQGEVWLCVCRS